MAKQLANDKKRLKLSTIRKWVDIYKFDTSKDAFKKLCLQITTGPNYDLYNEMWDSWHVPSEIHILIAILSTKDKHKNFLEYTLLILTTIGYEIDYNN